MGGQSTRRPGGEEIQGLRSQSHAWRTLAQVVTKNFVFHCFQIKGFWDTEQHSPEEWRATSCVPADCVGKKLKANFGFLSLNLHLGTVSKLIELSKVAGGATATPAMEITTTVSDTGSEEVVQVAAGSPARATLEASFCGGGLCVVGFESRFVCECFGVGRDLCV